MKHAVNNQDKFYKELLIKEVSEQYKLLTDGGRYSHSDLNKLSIKDLEEVRQTYWQQIESKTAQPIPEHYKYGVNYKLN